jgi:site-specific recombinase XerC
MSRRRPQPAEVTTAFEAIAGRSGSVVEIGARAARTWTQYRGALGLLATFAAGVGVPMPAPSETVRDWIVSLARRGRAVRTINSYLSAVRVTYTQRGWPLDKQMLSEAMRSIRRTFARPERRARPIRKPHLQELLTALLATRPADLRDAALMSVAWSKMLRQAEVTGLDWHRHGDGLGYIRVDGAGARIVLLKSKTMQDRDWRTVITRIDMPTAVEAIERWAAAAKLKPGAPVFVPVHGRRIGDRRLNPDAVCAILRRRVLRCAIAAGMAEVEAHELASAVSGHSPRSGAITEQHDAGVDLATIKRTSRHRRLDTLLTYVRTVEEDRDDGLAKVGF